MEKTKPESKIVNVLAPIIVITQRVSFRGVTRERNVVVFSDVDKAVLRFNYMYQGLQYDPYVRMWKSENRLKVDDIKTKEGSTLYKSVTMYMDGARETDYCKIELKAMNIDIRDVDALIAQYCNT